MSWNTAASAPDTKRRWFWQPSPGLSGGRLLLGMLALLALGISSLPLLWKVLAGLLVLADLALALWRLRQCRHPAWRRGLALAGKQWLYWTPQQGWCPVQLQAGTLVWSWLVVLELQPAGGRRQRLAVFWHLLPDEQFRRLKVALRFSRL